MCSNGMASNHVILNLIKQRLRVAVSREEKWYPMILDKSDLPLVPLRFLHLNDILMIDF